MPGSTTAPGRRGARVIALRRLAFRCGKCVGTRDYGFTICNDVSVREWQMRAITQTLGKSFDTHGPIGPWIVTTDDLPGVHDLSLKTWVNGELRQNGRTSELLYRFGEMLAELTTVFTLEPGDILSTGSPSGVGGAMRPPKYLKPGDVCRIEIEAIGYIQNRVVPEV